MRYSIYRGNQEIANIRPEGTVTERLMGEETVNITFSLTEKIVFHIGDRINVYGKKYFLSEDPSIIKKNIREFDYTMVFFSEKYSLRDIQLFFYDNENNLTVPDFSLMANAEMALDLVIANANRTSSGWSKGIVDETEVKNISFSESNCLEAITKIANEFNLEFWIDANKSIHFTERKPVSDYSFEYGKAKGLKSINRGVLEGGSLVTRLYAKGSEKNLPKNYRNGQKNLRMDFPYLEANTEIYGIKEHTESFSEIYPKRIGTVTAIDPNDPNRFTDADIDFDLNAYDAYGTLVLMNGIPAKVIFQTGQLAGYRLELIEAGGFNSATKTFYLNKNKDERDLEIPSEMLRPAVGDKYILEDIMMPEAYVLLAESELKTKAQEYLDQNSGVRFQYAIEADPIYFKNQNVQIALGSTVHFIDNDFDLNEHIRVTALQINLQNKFDVKFDLSEVTRVSSIVQNYYDQQEQTNTVINSIKYNAELARRNYLFGREFHDKVFDGEGYFDTENIKPLSIETKMISLGSRLQQFGLPGVDFKIVNNSALSNTAGKIAHQTIDPNAVREWNIPANTISGISNKFNYIYVKCQKVGINASFVVTEAQIKVEGDPDFYHFEVGYLSSIIDGYRKIKTTYGFAQLNPAELSIGRISDPTGNNYIDLKQDGIGIKAKVEFTSDSPAFEQVGNSIQIGGRNLAKNSKQFIDSNQPWVRDFLLSEILLLGVEYTFKVWTKTANQNPNAHFTIGDQSGWLLNLIKINDKEFEGKIKMPRNSNGQIVLQRVPNDDSWYQFEYFKVERGNKATDWTPAPEDIEIEIENAETAAQIANQLLADIADDNKLTPGEKQLLKKEYDLIISEKPQLQAQADTYGVSTTAYINAYNSLVVYTNPLLLNLNTTTDIVGSVLRNTFNNYFNSKVSLLKAITDKVRYNIDDIYSEIDRMEQELNDEINDVSNSVNNLNNYIDGAFSDGIISAAEAVAIEKYINQLNTEQADLQQKFEQIYNNTYLDGNPKIELNAAMGSAIKQGSGYLGAHKHLIFSIMIAIEDGFTTPKEKADVDNKFVLYKDALTFLATKFQSALSAIEQAKIDEIQVGGGNLALMSSGLIDSNNLWVRDFLLEESLVSGQKYTATIWTKVPNQNNNSFFRLGDVNGNLVADVIKIEQKMYRVTFIYSGPEIDKLILFRFPDLGTWYQFEKFKIEKGTRGTDWSPAVKDIQDNISTAQTTATNAINLLTDIGSDNKLTASEKQITLNEWNRIKSEYATNYSLASSLLLAVTSYQSAYNSLNLYITPLLVDLVTTSNINGEVFRNIFKNYYDHNIAIVIAIGNKQIENVQIGGRNLVRNSKKLIDNNFVCIDDFYLSQNLEIGKQYTVTIESVTQNSENFFYINDESGDQLCVLEKVSYNKFQKTFTAAKSVNKLIVFQYPNNNSWYQFQWIKLERGNKSTDWSPAPEDVEEGINSANQNSANALAQAQNAINTAASAAAVTSFLQTTIDGNVVSTGTLQVGDVNGANAMICGVTDQPNGESIRFAAGKPYSQKYLSPFQVLDNGMVRFVNPITGQKTFELGFNQNTGKVVFDIYNDSGIKVASIGPQGIMFTGYVPESYTKRKFRKLNTTSFTDAAIKAELVPSIMLKRLYATYPPSGIATDQTQYFYDIGLNTDTVAYEYYEGRNFESANNAQYAGFYTSANKLGNKLPDGIYLKQTILSGMTQQSTGANTIEYFTEAYLLSNGRITSAMEILKTLIISAIPNKTSPWLPEDYE